MIDALGFATGVILALVVWRIAFGPSWIETLADRLWRKVIG